MCILENMRDFYGMYLLAIQKSDIGKSGNIYLYDQKLLTLCISSYYNMQ